MHDLDPRLPRYFPRSMKAFILMLICTALLASIPAATLSLVLALAANNRDADLQAAADEALTANQVRACKRGNDIRQGLFVDAQNEERNAEYQAGQANDPEVESGWEEKAAYERGRQTELIRQAEDAGYRIPNTAQNDCDRLVRGP